MIICVCQAVSDRKIRAAVQSGAESLEDVQFQLGVASGCGQCAQAVCCLIAEEKKKHHAITNHTESPFVQTTQPLFFINNHCSS